jgi:hypothetical protein
MNTQINLIEEAADIELVKAMIKIAPSSRWNQEAWAAWERIRQNLSIRIAGMK